MESLGRLFHAQAAEEAQLHNLSFARLESRQRRQRIIDCQQILAPFLSRDQAFMQR